MWKKIKRLFVKPKTQKPELPKELYTREQVEKFAEEYGNIRYNDGKRDGLAIAREQASNSLKEILWQQNQSRTK